MAELVFVIGPSGSGKTSSILPNEALGIKGLDPEETLLITLTPKALPKKFYITAQDISNNPEKYKDRKPNRMIVPDVTTLNNKVVSKDAFVKAGMDHFLKSNPKIKNVVIDDFQYLSVLHLLDNVMTKGYEKFTENGKIVYEVLKHIVNLPDKYMGFILAHDEAETVNFEERKSLKLGGKMVKNTLGNPEGLSNTVLFTESQVEVGEDSAKVQKFFVTQSDGKTTAKSLPGMFPYRIPNDLGIVEKALREYFE